MPIKERRVVILLADPRELGAAMKAVSRRGVRTMFRQDLMRRFATAADAKRWLRKVPKTHPIKLRFRPMIDKL